MQRPPAMIRANMRIVALAFVASGICAVASGCAEAPPPAPIERFEPMAAGTCREWTGQPIDRVCVPRVVRENAKLTLEISESCGACGTTAERCTVTVDEKNVTLSLDGRVCEPPPGAQCADACARRRVVCRIPPLQSGRYLLRWGDMSGRVDTLDVTTDPTAPSSCSLASAEPG